ncbi:hypothetical protein D3C86_1412070 [compost metagenome]
MINLIALAPASMEFSINSFTAEAGRCTTSPAAIWLATESGNSCMISDMRLFYFLCRKLVCIANIDDQVSGLLINKLILQEF